MVDREKATPADVGASQPIEPRQDGDGSSWVLNGINQINEKIDRLDDRLNGRIDNLDERIRLVENKINRATGWVMAVGAVIVVLQLVLEFFDISVTRTP